MSVEGQVLGASTVAGGGAAGVAALANTGSPALIGAIVAVITIIVLGLVTRASQRR